MESTIATLTLIATIETIILIIGIIWGFVLWLKGIFPVVFRIGNGLAKRKIAIFAKGDEVGSLKKLLNDSGLFREKNIFEITKLEDFGGAESTSVYLVNWHDWDYDDIQTLVSKKPDKCAMIIYSPYNKGRIPDEQMSYVDGQRNTAVTNFRGRLLNDIVTSMITTNL